MKKLFVILLALIGSVVIYFLVSAPVSADCVSNGDCCYGGYQEGSCSGSGGTCSSGGDCPPGESCDNMQFICVNSGPVQCTGPDGCSPGCGAGGWRIGGGCSCSPVCDSECGQANGCGGSCGNSGNNPCTPSCEPPGNCVTYAECTNACGGTFSRNDCPIAASCSGCDPTVECVGRECGPPCCGGCGSSCLSCTVDGVCEDNGTCGGSTPSCSLLFDRNPVPVTVGRPTGVTVNVGNVANGTVSEVRFRSGGTSIFTVNPGSDTTPANGFTSTVTGVAAGSGPAYADGYMGGIMRCSTSTTVNVAPPEPWWQVRDGDVLTGGSLGSSLPLGKLFELRGLGGFPGVPAISTTASLGSGNASDYPPTTSGWKAENASIVPLQQNFNYFMSKIPSDVQSNYVRIGIGNPWNCLEGASECVVNAAGGTFNSGGTPARGYVWYYFDGSRFGNLRLTGETNLTQDRRIVLLVSNANLTIEGKMKVTDRGRGFVMSIVQGAFNITGGHSGNSNPSPQVDIEGLYVVDGDINTTNSTQPLYLRGSFISHGHINLRRDLSDDSSNPAEYFEFAPEMLRVYPNVFNDRKFRWREVAP